MRPKTNGHERRERPKPHKPSLWINPEKRKESTVFNRRNRYRLASAISALPMLASFFLTKMIDNELVIVVLVFCLAWLAGWRSHIIIQWRR